MPVVGYCLNSINIRRPIRATGKNTSGAHELKYGSHDYYNVVRMRFVRDIKTEAHVTLKLLNPTLKKNRVHHFKSRV